MTKRTIENLAGLNRKFKEQVEKFLFVAAQPICDHYGITIEVISGLRSWKQQAALYAQGRTKPGRIVTKARPGSSWHNYGLAVDLGLFAGGKYLDSSNPKRADKIYKDLGTLAATRGIEWAGTWTTFTETPHFQNRYGMTIAQAKAKLIANDYDIQKMA